MQDEALLARINALARKQKQQGLTDEEAQEQAQLRQTFLSAFRANLKASLDNIVVERPDGSRQTLSQSRKKEPLQ